jgi:O-antigen/teichoic acid export membrane protein
MKRRFFKDSLVYGGTAFLSRGASLLLLPVYTRLIAPEAYGQLEMLMVFAAWVAVTVALEVSQGFARYYAGADSEDQRGRYASTALWFTLGTHVLFLVPALVFARPISRGLLGGLEGIHLYRWMLGVIALNGVLQMLCHQLRWSLQAKAYALVSAVHALATLVASAVLVIFLHLDILGFIWGQGIGVLCGLLVALWLVRGVYTPCFDCACLREMLAFSIPLVPASMAVFVALYIDRIAIRDLLNLEEVGIYSVAYRFAAVAGLLIVGFQQALTPLVYHHYHKAETPGHLADIFRYFLALCLPIVLGVALFAPEAIRLLTAPAYHGAAVLVAPLFAAVLFSQAYIFFPGLGIVKKTLVIAGLNIFAAVLNTVLNFSLIPLWGPMGAAVATLLSALALLVGYALTSQRCYTIPFAWRAVGLSVLLAVVLSLLPQVFPDTPLALGGKILAWCVYAACLVPFGLVRKEELTALMPSGTG